MSIEALSWGFKQDIRVPGAKLVLLALCDFADESWSCFPGQETLAAKTSQSERTVRRHLDWLEDEGFIVSKPRFSHGRRTSNRYTIHTPRPSTPPPPPATDLAATDGEPEAHGDDTDGSGAAGKPPSPPEQEGAGAKQAAKMTGGHHGHRSDHAEQPANLTGEPSENHQQQTPLPRSGDDGEDHDRLGGCAAHPHAPSANCRGCGTNPRARWAAADADRRRKAREREQQDTQLLLQGLRVRRGTVERQERDGTLARARSATREAARAAREPLQRAQAPELQRQQYRDLDES
ncbi:helix-turn-helix domain-containing protein [Streptomyces sp. NPDC006356]